MKAYQIGAQNGLDGLTAVVRPDPVPGVGEAVVQVETVCLNHRDLMVLEGRYGPRRPAERVPLSEGVGTVVAVGPGVEGVAPGDRVIGPHFVTWLDGAFAPLAFATDIGITHDGWLAERLVLPAAAMVKVPDSMSALQAAPLASSALTAWHAVVEVGAVKAGDLVLALGTGGVSIFALQIARMCGARVAITSSSDAKLALARSMGAEITVNYATTPGWAAAVVAANGGRGADIVVETGGQGTLAHSIDASAPNARIVLIGALGGAAGSGLPNFGSIIGKNLMLKGIAEGSRAMLARLVGAVAANGMQPVIDRGFGFDDAKGAYAYLKTGSHVGKVVIHVA